ncbi:MAG: carbohydrate ABC transporter permease [Ktedonobacteraceae bacterium]
MSIQEQVMQPGVQAQRVPRPKGMRRWRNDLIGFGFVLPFLIAYTIFLLWPVLLGLRMSFYNWNLAGGGTSDFRGLGNYQELFADSNFWAALWHTILFTVLSTPILVVLALVLALLINRAIPAKWLFRLAFFAPFVLPVTVVVLIWNWLYTPGFGLINSILTGIGLPPVNWLTDPHVAMISVVIVTVWWTVGGNFLLYSAGLQQIPHDLYEASAIDGAGAWAQIRRITIPMLGRITTLIVILQVIASLQVFSQIYLLTAGGPDFVTRPVIQYIYETGFSSFRVGYASAASYVLFVMILVVTAGQFILLQRQGQKRGA